MAHPEHRSSTLVIGNDILSVQRFLEQHKNGSPLSLNGVVGTVVDPKLDRVVGNILESFGLSRALYKKVICDPESLRKHKQLYRDDFSSRLAVTVGEFNSDMNIFAHMMYVTSAPYTSSLGHKTCNEHPSVLPKFRGGHPEIKAYRSGELDGLGFTIHTLNSIQGAGDTGKTVELDNGTVIVHQQVEPSEPYDAAAAEALGEAYERPTEERIRLTVMWAAANVTARAAHLVATATPETMHVVRDEEAFRAEGPERLDFFHSPSFQHLLQSDYEAHLKKNSLSSQQLPFREWHETKYPGYTRALFQDSRDAAFKPAEQIFDIPKVARGINVHPMTRYDFAIKAKTVEAAVKIYQGLLMVARGPNGDQLHSSDGGTERHWVASEGILICSIVTTRDMSSIIGSVSEGYQATTLSVRVGAGRYNGNFQGLMAILDETKEQEDATMGHA